MSKHTLVATVEEGPVVLNRVLSLFRQRSFAIESGGLPDSGPWKIFSGYNEGSYLIWRFDGRVKVYSDTRGFYYPGEFLDDSYILPRAVGDWLREHGARPFLFPAMGSHNGGTAEGQRAMIESLGLTEEAMGMPIRSSMDVVKIGTVSSGDVWMDRHAYEQYLATL